MQARRFTGERWAVAGACVLAALGAVAAAGCSGSEDDWVVRPPGGGPGGGTHPDGGTSVDASSGGNGRLCVVDDLRAPDACPATADVAGVRVRVEDGPTVTTDANGRFDLSLAQAAIVDVGETTATLVPGVSRVEPGGPIAVRAMHVEPFDDLLLAVGGPPLTQGAIAIYVEEQAGGPAQDVSFDQLGGATFPVLYDAGGATSWQTDAGTGAAGVALMLDVPAGSYTLTGTVPGSSPFTITEVPVRAGALTFVRRALP
ncbi:MAG TPA: hypothetical protein VHE35_09410 [Kofleriaceae bacterium]|nr:hypothetical protein [Kofleriaceae bacterium]